MATKMWESDSRSPEGANRIPYSDLARDLFKGPPQILVPFLGAGASISEKKWPDPPELGKPDQDRINQVCNDLSLDGRARDFLEGAIRVAWQIQQHENAPAGPAQTAYDSVKNSDWPPSASELAAALADSANYDHFERLAITFGKRLPKGDPAILAKVFRWAASVSGVASTSPPLMSVASYYSHLRGPDIVWRRLQELFANKTKPTIVHRMVACIASVHTSLFDPADADNDTDTNPSKNDYLIVTTNYDRLIEEALKLAKVPSCVLTVDKTGDSETPRGKVRATPSEGLRDYLQLKEDRFRLFLSKIEQPATNSTMGRHAPIAIVYKMHGCLYPPGLDRNNVILTDEDYVEYMRQNGLNNAMLPAFVKNGMDTRGFLFMGYSFSDWNVRSWYQSLMEDAHFRERRGLQDFAVVIDSDPYQDVFFDKKGINLVYTELKRFAESILKYIPEKAKDCGALNG